MARSEQSPLCKTAMDRTVYREPVMRKVSR